MNNKAKLANEKGISVFKSYKAIEIALYSQLGKLPEPKSSTDSWRLRAKYLGGALRSLLSTKIVFPVSGCSNRRISGFDDHPQTHLLELCARLEILLACCKLFSAIFSLEQPVIGHGQRGAYKVVLVLMEIFLQ